MWQIVSMLRVRKHENHYKLILLSHHDLLWKALSDMVKFVVRVRAGKHSCYRREHHPKSGTYHRDAEGYLLRYCEKPQDVTNHWYVTQKGHHAHKSVCFVSAWCWYLCAQSFILLARINWLLTVWREDPKGRGVQISKLWWWWTGYSVAGK